MTTLRYSFWMEIAQNFAPHQSLAKQLLPHAVGATDDGSHDLSHILRVWKNVQAIVKTEGGDGLVLAAATLLHDCVDVPKDSPLRSSASRLAAEKAFKTLIELGWCQSAADKVAHAIEAHSFSAKVDPTTLEAKILQDADRLDAIGHTGIARCFYVSGRLGRALYDPLDPSAAHRDLDDMSYAIDHFKTKLLRLSGSFQTTAGNAFAAQRHQVLEEFMTGFLAEVRSS
ncbi:MAG: HD domain-containing protein [Roseobacter sp.]